MTLWLPLTTSNNLQLPVIIRSIFGMFSKPSLILLPSEKVTGGSGPGTPGPLQLAFTLPQNYILDDIRLARSLCQFYLVLPDEGTCQTVSVTRAQMLVALNVALKHVLGDADGDSLVDGSRDHKCAKHTPS
jgi:hypothetical protein